jgi:AcrR family transcriptional regulator
MGDDNTPKKPSLRERKKARTREAIQRHALRLVAAQGYDATTVAEIAEAAEIAESTLFRYFPTKESIFLYDELDAVYLDLLRSLPPEMGPVDTIREALTGVLHSMSPDDLSTHVSRSELIFTVPQLRAATMDDLLQMVDVVSESLAQRVDRPPDDVGVRALAGASLGLTLSMLVLGLDQSRPDWETLLEQGYQYLKDGFEFSD